jgi:hypothetical protein
MPGLSIRHLLSGALGLLGLALVAALGLEAWNAKQRLDTLRAQTERMLAAASFGTGLGALAFRSSGVTRACANTLDTSGNLLAARGLT